MRILSILGGLAALGILVWAVVAVAGLPAALAVSAGGAPTLALLMFSVAVVVVAGARATGRTKTTYW
ncbi:MAG: hypothetical protein ABEJ59_00175 [Halanaeroarchaeum sp.]